jgi:5-methylcytosine-specific restriction protein A
VLARARHRCRCRGPCCPKPCGARAVEVDHVVPGDDHSVGNLMALCSDCHAAKTARETGERNARYAAMRRRPQEKHPGELS